MKGVCIALFGLIFYIGFLVTYQQADRLETATQTDAINKSKYDGDLRELGGKVTGIQTAVDALARAPGGDKWDVVSGQIKELKRDINQKGVIAQQPTGNLKETALSLSNEVLLNLYQWGWREGTPESRTILSANGKSILEHMPGPYSQREVKESWEQARSFVFSWKMPAIMQLQQDCAKINVRDSQLDSDLRLISLERGNPTDPQLIESVGEDLRRLANELSKLQ